MSTSTVNCDRTGYVEETLYDSGIDWYAEYNKLISMSKRDLLAQSNVIIGKFPNAHCYTKRMTEHLLSSNNIKGIPIVILRPSILGAALNEPVPGWIDTTSFMAGVTLLVGHGILTQIPCKQDAFVDIIPVDYVVKQIFLSIPFLVKSHRESGGKNNFFITSCSTSS